LPQWHPDWQAGACIAAWRVQAVLAQAAGCALHHLAGLPQGVAGIAWQAASGRHEMLLANLGARAVGLPLGGNWLALDVSIPGSAVSLLGGLSAIRNTSTLGAYQVLWFWQ